MRFLLTAVLLAVSAPAVAADATASVLKADKGVRIGRDPDWRAAAPGMAIGVADLLDVPQGAKVTIKMPDGKAVELEGRTVLSGKRLLTDKTAAGRVVFFSKAFQEANSGLVVEVAETGSTAIAARGAKAVPEDDEKIGKRKRPVAFLGDDDSEYFKLVRSTNADFAESYVRRGDWQLAADAAWQAIVSPDSTPLDRRRGHIIMARLATNEGQHEIAMRDLDLACRSAGVDSSDRPYLAAALVARGQSWMALGDDAKANEDFRAALEFDTEGAAGAQANFFLGALALSNQDIAGAKTLFGRLKGYPELSQAGAELLAAVGP